MASCQSQSDSLAAPAKRNEATADYSNSTYYTGLAATRAAHLLLVVSSYPKEAFNRVAFQHPQHFYNLLSHPEFSSSSTYHPSQHWYRDWDRYYQETTSHSPTASPPCNQNQHTHTRPETKSRNPTAATMSAAIAMAPSPAPHDRASFGAEAPPAHASTAPAASVSPSIQRTASTGTPNATAAAPAPAPAAPAAPAPSAPRQHPSRSGSGSPRGQTQAHGKSSPP